MTRTTVFRRLACCAARKSVDLSGVAGCVSDCGTAVSPRPSPAGGSCGPHGPMGGLVSPTIRRAPSAQIDLGGRGLGFRHLEIGRDLEPEAARDQVRRKALDPIVI